MDYRYRQEGLPPLSKTEDALVKFRQDHIAERVNSVLTDVSFATLATPTNIRSKGGIAFLRQIGFAKLALLNGGRSLLTHWPEIKREVDIPWNVHYYQKSLAAWVAQSSELESRFFSSKTSDFSATELQLYGGGWLPFRADDIPGFALVETDDALKFARVVDGTVNQRQGTFNILDPGTLDAISGETREYDIHTGAAEPFVSFELDEFAPVWVAIEGLMSISGKLILSPSLVIVNGAYSFDLLATDGFGNTADRFVTVEVKSA